MHSQSKVEGGAPAVLPAVLPTTHLLTLHHTQILASRQMHAKLKTPKHNHTFPHTHTISYTHTYTHSLWTPCQVQLCFHRGTAGPEQGYFRQQHPDWIKAGLIPVEFVSFFQATLNPNQIIQPDPCCHYHHHPRYCSSQPQVCSCACISLSFPLLQLPSSVFLPLY